MAGTGVAAAAGEWKAAFSLSTMDAEIAPFFCGCGEARGVDEPCFLGVSEARRGAAVEDGASSTVSISLKSWLAALVRSENEGRFRLEGATSGGCDASGVAVVGSEAAGGSDGGGGVGGGACASSAVASGRSFKAVVAAGGGRAVAPLGWVVPSR